MRFPEERRRDIPELERLLVPAPGGERVPLAQLAEVQLVEAPAQVSRENGMRRVVVEANVRGRDLGGFVEEVQAKLAPLVKELPAGLLRGVRRPVREPAARHAPARHRGADRAPAHHGPALYLALGSIGNSLLVLLNLPFALVGGVIAVVAFRMPLSVSAAVAFIVLLGIAVQNGVVLVAFFRQLRERGRSPSPRRCARAATCASGRC